MANSPIAPNRTKQALRDGKAVLGTMVAELRQPSVMQLLVNGGFDYVIIDNEHGPFNIETIADLSRTAVYLGLTPIVRVPDIAYPYIAQSLDGGAQGIMAPRIYTVEQTQQVVQTVKYPPLGQRGSATSRGHTKFLGGNVSEIMAQANEESLVVIQIETVAALESIDAIVSVPGVDVAFIGPNDLSIALGVAGQMTAPVLVSAIEKIMDSCSRHGVTTAIQMNDMKLATQWAERGIKMMSYSAEAGLLTSAALSATNALREAYKGKVEIERLGDYMSKESVLAELTAQVGSETHVSDWLPITQAMIDQFATATRDQQWIHVDPPRAQTESPFANTIAHGFFTLSLIPFLTGSIDPSVERYPGKKLAVNYGLNRVRFPHPVLVNSHVRSHSIVISVQEVSDGLQIINQITIEIKGQPKPACVAEMISRIYF